MRLETALEKDGYWWLPENEAYKVPGKLRCSQGAKLELEVVGIVSGMPIEMMSEIPTIYGFTTEGELVTLQHNYVTTTSMRAPGIATARYVSSAMLIGVHVSHPQAKFFRTVRVSFEGLDQWLELSGFNLQVNERRTGFTMIYSLPDEIRWNIANNLSVGFEFSWIAKHRPASAPINYSIDQTSVIRIDFGDDSSINDAWELIFRLNHLLCFATAATLNLKKCVLSGPSLVERSEGLEIPRDVSLFYESQPAEMSESNLKPDEILFRFRDVREFFGEFLGSYVASYQELAEPLDLYFGVMTRRGIFIQQKFLGVVQALEAFHRRTTVNQVLPEAEHEARIGTVLSSAPEAYREWLSSRLVFSNEPTLRARLKELMAPVKQIFWKNSADRDAFINKVTNTRNYLTHFSPALKDKAASPQEMLFLIELLRALFEVTMLRFWGFDEDHLRVVISKNRRLKDMQANVQ